MEDVAESFLAALDKLYDFKVPKLSILAEGLFGANCASYMIVSCAQDSKMRAKSQTE